MREAGGESTGEVEVVVGSGDRARARPGQIGGVGPNFENHVGGMVLVQAVAVTVGESISEKTIETVWRGRVRRRGRRRGRRWR